MIDVVAALIRDDNKFLICQRSKNKSQGLLWEFVGGKVENGESKEDALIRECQEELDVKVVIKKEITSTVYEYPNVTIHLTLFLTAISEGKIKKIEHEDIRWIMVDEIPNYEFCPADKAFLTYILKEFK